MKRRIFTVWVWNRKKKQKKIEAVETSQSEDVVALKFTGQDYLIISEKIKRNAYHSRWDNWSATIKKDLEEDGFLTKTYKSKLLVFEAGKTESTKKGFYLLESFDKNQKFIGASIHLENNMLNTMIAFFENDVLMTVNRGQLTETAQEILSQKEANEMVRSLKTAEPVHQ